MGKFVRLDVAGWFVFPCCVREERVRPVNLVDEKVCYILPVSGRTIRRAPKNLAGYSIAIIDEGFQKGLMLDD